MILLDLLVMESFMLGGNQLSVTVTRRDCGRVIGSWTVADGQWPVGKIILFLCVGN